MKSRQTFHLLYCSALCLSLASTSSLGQPVRSLSTKWSTASTIDLTRDYVSVTLVDGWFSKQESALVKLFSTNRKLALLMESDVTYFDGAKTTLAVSTTNPSLSSKLNIPWGVNPVVIDRMPAAAVGTLAIRATLYKDDTIEAVLKSVSESSASIPAVAASPYLGYATIVSGLFKTLFGTAKESYPFLWSGDLRTGGTLAEQYLVLIAPTGDADDPLKNWDQSKLAYTETNRQLTYDGKPVDRSVAVFKIMKVTGADVVQLLVFESTAPWAVLGVNSFLSVPADQATNADQLATLARGLVGQLTNEIDLLKREHRFSAYSRAQALSMLAQWARDPIAARCKELNIAACPLSGIDQIATKTSALFGLTKDRQSEIDRDAKTAKKDAEAFQQFQRLMASARDNKAVS